MGDRLLRKTLRDTKPEELMNRRFEVLRVTVRLCEICSGVIDEKEQPLRTIQISTRGDYEKLLTRSRIYDDAEVGTQESKIYFFDHDYPGEVHPRCLEKLLGGLAIQ